MKCHSANSFHNATYIHILHAKCEECVHPQRELVFLFSEIEKVLLKRLGYVYREFSRNVVIYFGIH